MGSEPGQIKAGFLADIIAVEGDPLKDVSVLNSVGFVMKNGKIYKQKHPNIAWKLRDNCLKMRDALNTLQQAQRSGMLQPLMEQLQKDYQRAGLEYPLKGRNVSEMGLAELFSLIKEHMYRLLMESFEQHLTLMYAVDVPERNFGGIKPEDAVDAADHLTGMVLAREWQKIQMRRRFNP